ncbi:hypothetical protein LA080_007429 [Diaporthe eres]|nr:hypothetical protein LA080_007429 [Diaporthe eres]
MPVRRKQTPVKRAPDPADPAKGVIWTSAKGPEDDYLELLKSGALSDTQIHCGKRIWKEAENGIVNIEEFKENEVECLLHYIYTGSINVSKSFTTPIGLHACMSIWRVGDFFLLEGLCRLALDEADRTFRGVSWCFTATQETESSKQSATSNIVKLVRALYNQGPNDVRDAFRPTILAFLMSGVHILEKNKTFKDLIHEIPAFASDWAATLTDNMSSVGSKDRLGECAKCKASCYSGGVMLGKWIKEQKVEGFCGTCFPLQQLEDWVGEDSGNT